MGALDGGLNIAHSDKRFVGFKKDKKQLGAEIHRKYIYEGHVADYMKSIADEESKKYQSNFSEYIKKNITADDMEALYKKVHAAIRAYPTMAKSTKEPPKTHKSLRRHRAHGVWPLHCVLHLAVHDELHAKVQLKFPCFLLLQEFCRFVLLGCKCMPFASPYG
ncbi:hypothetical protein CFC21_095791 [Triticum aestivum]|uniref:Large ribosomal subunit protein uL18 C-terminal eukaryotes domain-containing protein n=2 Tax=Triticum aestivum TaxID=4565 RepID=A0A9R1LR47_WHEAT|nr:hypothetical protein CFC21_095791 [Triticum aestivum]